LPLETATFIPDLVTSNPAHTDGLAQADSHARLIKSVLQNTFPNFTDVALNSSQALLDAAVAVSTGTADHRTPVGTAALPALTSSIDPTTGFFWPATGQLGFSISGVQAMLLGGTALVTSLSIATTGLIGGGAVASTGAYSGGTGQLVPIGSTVLWWDDVLPTEGGYVWANGQPISRAGFPILFARWGTRFGVGDGSTTFGVPDLRDTVPVGKSTMGGAVSRALQTLANTVLGTLFGEANHTLASNELPAHSHPNTLNDPGHTHPQNANTGYENLGGGIGQTTGTAGSVITSNQSTQSNTTGVTITNANSTGGGGAHNNVQPSTTCNYILRAA
jgi:microcystin-dependent protein